MASLGTSCGATARRWLLVVACAWACVLEAVAHAQPAGRRPGEREGPRATPAGLEPSQPRERMSAFLVEPAERAVRAGDLAVAISLYQGMVAARGPASAEARELARLWAMTGQVQEAMEVLDEVIASTSDADARSDLEAERARLAQDASTAEPPARRVVAARSTRYARQAFRRGRAAFRARQYADALVYFQMGYALDPELPGFLRELGATYDKLGVPGKKIEFYQAYLRARPFGATARAIRAELSRHPGALSTLDVTSSLPCDELWINRQRAPAKLPIQRLEVAPGSYRGLCVSYAHEMAYFEYTRVVAGKPGRLDFRWAILVNQLDAPFGRIAVENPRAPGVMMDLGISTPAVGVIVPGDGRPLRMMLRDDLGNRREERHIKLEPGQRHVVKW